MSNKPAQSVYSATENIPASWTQFINDILTPINDPWVKFPKKQILSFLQSNKCPKIKQLLEILIILCERYKQCSQYFRQIIVMMYLLLVKGCVNTSMDFISVSMDVLEELLRYRLIIVCSSTVTNPMVSVYSYMQHWLGLLVPAMLMHQANTKQKNKKAQKTDKQKTKQIKNKSLMHVLQSINKKSDKKRKGCQSSNTLTDPLLLIFQTMLVMNIRNHLTHASLFQFDSVMRKIYSYCPEKYQMVYQGKGCVSHIINKQKQKIQKQRELIANNVIKISDLIPARMSQMSWQTYDLQLQLPTQSSRNQLQNSLKLKKINSDSQMQQWVSQAFKLNSKPTQIKLNFNSLMTRMKALQIYKFLCLLEIYGSSPNIEILNEYITDQRVLQFFTKFLLGQSLVQAALELGDTKQNQRNVVKSVYQFKNEKFNKILQICMKQAMKLGIKQDRQVFLEEFQTKLQNIKEQSKNLGINTQVENKNEQNERNMSKKINNKK